MSAKIYTPILRWKGAEKSAVKMLNVRERLLIKPLIELVMPSPKLDKNDRMIVLADSETVLRTRLPKFALELTKCWGNGDIYVDAHLVNAKLRANTFSTALNSAHKLGVKVVPVTLLIPTAASFEEMASRKVALDFAHTTGSGVCIRIDRLDLNNDQLTTIVRKFLMVASLAPEDIDLLIDLNIVGQHDTAAGVSKEIAVVPFLNRWRSFTIAGGAFPHDLSDLEKHEHHTLSRHDWSLWQAIKAESTFPRMPIYADYTIQHPIPGEYTPGMNPSASIRYTSHATWEIMRGEGLRNKKGQGHKQYPAQAKLLSKQQFFQGNEHCYGDTYIMERADPANTKPGTPTTWLAAGINHHISLTALQCANSV